MADDRRDGGGIEDVTEVDREDGEDDRPGRDRLPEELDRHHLARAGIDEAAARVTRVDRAA